MTTPAPAPPPAIVMTTSCGLECQELYSAIKARMLGRKVASAGHKGRSLSYADASVGDMIKLYGQLRAQCAEAQKLLPELKPLDQYHGQRGRAFGARWR